MPAVPRTSVIARDQFLSFEIDMDLQIVHASSVPACLTKHPKDLFSPEGVELLERTWAQDCDGVSALSFSALELAIGAAGESNLVNGILQVVQTQAGGRLLLLNCAVPPGLTITPRGSLVGSLLALPDIQHPERALDDPDYADY
ncbi:unnamed protein product, partial [Symbiodinium pilosum]